MVGIERQGNRILNPDSETIFEKGDIVWIAGDKQLIRLIGQTDEQAKEVKLS